MNPVILDLSNLDIHKSQIVWIHMSFFFVFIWKPVQLQFITLQN